MMIYSNSRVHGNRTLYAEARLYHYTLLLLNCWLWVFLPRMVVEGGNSEALLSIVTTYYYTMMQQLLLHCYFHFCYINCWLILLSCCKTRVKMLVFDRLSYSLSPWNFYRTVHYTTSSSILIPVDIS